MDPITAFIINLVIGVIFATASTLLAQSKQHDQQRAVAGVRGTIQTGGDVPLSFIMGFYGTAGSLDYVGTWGSAGGTPNAYLTKVISLSDPPVRGLDGFFVNGVRCTLGDTASGDLGLPVTEYAGKMWVKFYDGTQTVADPLLLSAFGTDPDKPWQSDMIGRGVAYAVVTALFDRETFNGIPDYFFEVNGIELDDPRGDDAHENPVVGIRTIMKGLSYDGAWLYGPQAISDARLPSANWEAQMDKCDAIDADSGEPRFRFGLEIAVSEEPHAVIGELLKACAGRIAEIGGVYKVLAAEPEEPVLAFTDEDIVISAGQSYEPFPGLENTYNAITATYPEPEEAWENKEAPPRYRSDLELLDDGRRLPFSTSYKAVPFPLQVQRLMVPASEETRRFRKHSHTAPPEWWEYEPLDVVAWTSGRNGYSAKQFIITVMDDLPNCNQVVGLQEIDPADYDPSDYELPFDLTPLPIARPAPQPMTGFAVSPYIIVDSAAAPRRPAILVEFAGGLQDVRAVRIQAKLDGDIVFDGETPYDITEASPSRVLSGAWCVSNEEYEVSGRLLPFSGRETEWSAWLAVTTPDVPEVSVTTAQIMEAAGSVLNQLGQMRTLIEQFRQIGTTLEEMDRENFHERQTLSRSISKKLGDLEASFDEIIEVAIGPGGAIATALESLYAAMGANSAQVNVRWQAVAASAGYEATYAIQAAVNDGTFRSATLFLDVPSDPGQPTRIGLMAGQTVFYTSAGDPLALVDEDGFLRSANGSVEINLYTGDFSFGV